MTFNLNQLNNPVLRHAYETALQCHEKGAEQAMRQGNLTKAEKHLTKFFQEFSQLKQVFPMQNDDIESLEILHASLWQRVSILSADQEKMDHEKLLSYAGYVEDAIAIHKSETAARYLGTFADRVIAFNKKFPNSNLVKNVQDTHHEILTAFANLLTIEQRTINKFTKISEEFEEGIKKNNHYQVKNAFQFFQKEYSKLESTEEKNKNARVLPAVGELYADLFNKYAEYVRKPEPKSGHMTLFSYCLRTNPNLKWEHILQFHADAVEAEVKKLAPEKAQEDLKEFSKEFDNRKSEMDEEDINALTRLQEALSDKVDQLLDSQNENTFYNEKILPCVLACKDALVQGNSDTFDNEYKKLTDYEKAFKKKFPDSNLNEGIQWTRQDITKWRLKYVSENRDYTLLTIYKKHLNQSIEDNNVTKVQNIHSVFIRKCHEIGPKKYIFACMRDRIIEPMTDIRNSYLKFQLSRT